MKTYTLYVWTADNEGDYAVCKTEKFTPERDYFPQTGWRARFSEKIAEFDTDDELASILEQEYKKTDAINITYRECLTDAHDLMREYKLKELGWI